ncbi:Endonuclease/exonuclease/phosphatase [Syncephalis plumigaleata]|nr:Endonuclease/exonuclease/phosphatase [Syncephalis plumigaleata]
MTRDEQAGKISRIELNDFPQPDARFPSRRPPVFRDLESELKHIGPARCFAMSTRHVITAANALRVWDVVMGTPVSMASRGNEIRVDACCFLPPRLPSEESQWIWCALKTGELWEVEAETGVITDQRTGAHTCSVTHMLRARAHLWTLDESGRLQCWYQQGDTGRLSLKGQPTLRRVAAKVVAAIVVASEQLWLSTGKVIEVYLPLARSDNQSKHNDANVGDITCMSVDNSVKRVFTGHADGHVTIWCSRTHQRLQVYKASLYAITALASPGQQQHLWAAFQTGKICVYDTSRKPWAVIKDWQAHDKAVQAITVDNASLALLGRLQVASLDIEGCVRIWDGLLCDDFIDAHITLKQNEFCNYRDINVLICSWNCDARKPKSLLSNSLNAQFLKEWLTASPVTPDIIVVGFQEIIDLESKKTTAKSLLKSKKKAQTEEASRRYGLWRSRLVVAVQEAHPNETYSLLKSEHLVGLFSCMFVRRTIYDSVAGVTASMVKTGFGGRYGNKGGIAMRLVINDSSVCFVNCHLAAGQKEVSQRNTDAAKVLRECELEPLTSRPLAFVCGGDGLKMTDHEFCFFSGDLNYRIDLPRTQVESLIADRDWTQLMEHDQLCQQRARNRQHPLRSFSELPLDFIPTYKYNRGEEVFDTSEKMRIPAWCDRILHRYGGRPGPILPDTSTSPVDSNGTDATSPRIQQMSYRRHECLVSDHRPISASFQISARHINKEKRSRVERTVADIHLANIRSQAQEAMVDWLVNMGYAPADAMNALRREHWDIHAAANFLQEARLRGF